MPSKTVVSIVCITILLAIALIKGVNGVALASGIGVIAGLGAWAVHKVKKS